MTLDRFDPGRERAAAEPGRVPVAALPGDALVPFSFSGQESSEDLIQSEAELTRSIAVSPAHRPIQARPSPSKGFRFPLFNSFFFPRTQKTKAFNQMNAIARRSVRILGAGGPAGGANALGRPGS